MNPIPTPHAQELMEYMSGLSEEAYCAGWMQDLEYELWRAVVGETTRYGRLTFDTREVDRLRELSQRPGGWIVFDDVVGERWVPHDEWVARFDEWSRGR